MLDKLIVGVGATVIVLLIVVGLGLLLSFPLMLLWNGCLVPAVSGLSDITWMQAWGILIASNILFKNTSYKKD
jgi:hypothetical protein